MLTAPGMMPVLLSSAGSRTSMRITGWWVGEGVADGRVAVIWWGVSLDTVVAKVGGAGSGDDGESGPGLRLQSPIAGIWGRRNHRWTSGLAGAR